MHWLLFQTSWVQFPAFTWCPTTAYSGCALFWYADVHADVHKDRALIHLKSQSINNKNNQSILNSKILRSLGMVGHQIQVPSRNNACSSPLNPSSNISSYEGLEWRPLIQDDAEWNRKCKPSVQFPLHFSCFIYEIEIRGYRHGSWVDVVRCRPEELISIPESLNHLLRVVLLHMHTCSHTIHIKLKSSDQTRWSMPIILALEGKRVRSFRIISDYT